MSHSKRAVFVIIVLSGGILIILVNRVNELICKYIERLCIKTEKYVEKKLTVGDSETLIH